MDSWTNQILNDSKTWYIERHIRQEQNSKIDYDKVWLFITRFNQGKTQAKPNLEDPNEKNALTHFIYRNDIKNLIEKKRKYSCDVCHEMGYTLGHCEICIRNHLKANFSAWTSGNDEVDKCIQEAQTDCPVPRQIYELIPWKDFNTFQTDICQLLATWTRGYVRSFDRSSMVLIRNQNCQVVLKQVATEYVTGTNVGFYLFILILR